MDAELEQRLAAFVRWAQKNVKGDEKGEAQIFLDRLFQAFGHEGVAEAGAKLEFRIKKEATTGFADLVWKPVVLIEMKRRGQSLGRHRQQAFTYWERLVPQRPRYVLLCNFDEFWVYDFDTQIDEPVDTLKLSELPTRYGPLRFLEPHRPSPVFHVDVEEVNRSAAAALAECFHLLTRRGIERARARRFVLQCLVALFAEDIQLLPRYFFTELLTECTSPERAFDLLDGLFRAMNDSNGPHGGRFKSVRYFNGGLFRESAALELLPAEVDALQRAAGFKWQYVRPEIFGTLFELSMNDAERHAKGAHFTAPTDIMRIVGPTIVEPWQQMIAAATTLREINRLRYRLQRFRILDPACGSGNFLYLAYRELKRIEAQLIEKHKESSKRAKDAQLEIGLLSARNFFGIDVDPFAADVAKVTMMVGRKLAIDELHLPEQPLPLVDLEDNFLVADALLDELGNPRQWPHADVIIGNPPFISSKHLKRERGDAYVNRLRKVYKDVPGMADYCVYWLRRAHDHLPEWTPNDPVSGRAGLVGTQNIRNNKSREGGLDHIVRSGTIVDAVDNLPWSGEAAVHVSIVNWVKSESPPPGLRRLWKVITPPSMAAKVSKSSSVTRRTYDLGLTLVPSINSSLSDAIDVSSKEPLACNKTPKRCFQGKIPGYAGFLVDANIRQALIQDSSAVVVPYLTGRELLDDFEITRWAIDFGNRDVHEAAKYRAAFEHVREHVLPEVTAAYEAEATRGSDMAKARHDHLQRWWQFWNRRDELSAFLGSAHRYIACSRVTRRPIMAFVSAHVCPSDLVQVFAFEDDYSFGILQSSLHFLWFRTSSRLKIESDTRYSVREVFETFPWPQGADFCGPPLDIIDAIAETGRLIRQLRDQLDLPGGLRALYRILELPGHGKLRDAHRELDRLVWRAYGFRTEQDGLTQLLELNRVLAQRLLRAEPLVRPGLPLTAAGRDGLISADCLGAPTPRTDGRYDEYR